MVVLRDAEAQASAHAVFQCSLCRAVWWFPTGNLEIFLPPAAFSALSVEPYGGSPCYRCRPSSRRHFQCSLCRAVWWFNHIYVRYRYYDFFQCSLCRAVWWFGHDVGTGDNAVSAFSALSVEPYGGSAGRHPEPAPAAGFQCSLCRAVWWFFGKERGAAAEMGFQCSLCRAVWWFLIAQSRQNLTQFLSVLSL